MKKLPLAIVLGMIALLFVLAGQSKFGLFATVAQQTEVTLPEPDLSAFPVPIVKAITKKIGEYPIDTNLTTFQSLKREINTDLLPVGDHVFFASNKTVYRLTRGEKRTLEFPSPLTRVITDWQQRLFVMTSDRWVYVFDVNTLQKIGKFQVKYNQKVSEFVYLSDNIILVGFDFWKDEAQKKPNTWVAVAYTLNGQEKWKIKNMGMSGNNLDRRSFFEVLQVGTRGFLASCCNSSVRKEPYDGALQNAFAYENKTGILKVGEVNRGLQEPNPPNFELENSDSELYTNTEKALNLSDFRYLPEDTNLDKIYSVISDQFSKILPPCDNIFGNKKWIYDQKDRYLTGKVINLMSNYNKTIFFSYTLPDICGSITSGFNLESKKILENSGELPCLNNDLSKYSSYSEKLVNKIELKSTEFFINTYDSAILKLKNGVINQKCLWYFDKKYTKTSGNLFFDYNKYKIKSLQYGNKSSFTSVNLSNDSQIYFLTSKIEDKLISIERGLIEDKYDGILYFEKLAYAKSGKKILVLEVKK